MYNFSFDKVIIIGLGLIGGAVSKACRKYYKNLPIAAYDICKDSLDYALKSNIIDEIYNLEQGLRSNQLLIIAVNISYSPIWRKEFYATLNKIALNSQGNAVYIWDVSSVKEIIEKEIMPIFGHNSCNFVSAHPIAGSEQSGVEHSVADLFLGKKLIITPTDSTSNLAIVKVGSFWKKLGCVVESTTSSRHDQIFALVSHLPQLLSFVAKDETYQQLKLSSNEKLVLDKHFRLQNSNQDMWKNIFNLNRKQLLYYLQFYLQNLYLLKEKIANQDYDWVWKFLEKTLHRASQCTFQRFERGGGDHTPLTVQFWFEDSINSNFLWKRIFLVAILLSLPDWENFKTYAGSGFQDFSTILDFAMNFLELKQKNHDLLKNLAKAKSEDLIIFLNKISYNLNSYEFE